MHKIEAELRKKLKIKPDANEERSAFLVRLFEVCEALDDKEWENLSEGAQDWVNTAVKAVKSKKDIADFEESEDKPKARARAASKEDGKESARKGSSDKMSSMMYIRHYLVSNPDASVDECLKAVEKGGYDKLPTKITIGTVRSEFRSLVRIFKERSLLKSGVDMGSF